MMSIPWKSLFQHPARKKVTLAIVNKRKRIVREFRRRYGLKAPDLARRAAISQTAILGIVNEDWLRFASDTQVRFLKLIGKSLDDLYTE
jgi:hypothetical protein